MLRLCFRNIYVPKRNEPPSEFDVEYGVQTDGWRELSDLKVDSPSEIWGQAYAPTPAIVFDRIMTLLPEPEAYSFVDLGSGKGRVVLMAARRPFRSVTGVEFSPELCALAENNLARFTPHIVAREVRIVCGDAALFEYPPGPLIVYCYFAFTKEVLIPVLAQLLRRQDETIFVYFNAHYHELFAEFQLVHQENVLWIWRIGKITATASG